MSSGPDVTAFSAEPERLADLAGCGMLDGLPGDALADVVRLATMACGTPAALLTLGPAERQWFGAKPGFEGWEPSLRRSDGLRTLCGCVPLVIADLTRDPRMRTDGVVTGAPLLRFYAGAPILSGEGVLLGSLCVLDDRLRPDAFEEAHRFALLVLARQIGSQIDAHQTLARQREEGIRDQQIIASALDYGIITLDLGGFITSWSAGAQHLTGWAEDEVVGEPVGIFFTPESRAAGIPEREMRDARLQGRGKNERWHLRKDGSRFWGFGEMMPLLSVAGSTIGYLKILRDRTEQRAAIERLRASEERLAFVFEASGTVGWWDWSVPDDRVVCNEAFARLYRVDPRAADQGLPIAAFTNAVHPDDRDRVQAALSQALATAGSFSEEFRIVQGEHNERWVLTRGRCFHDDQLRPMRFPGVAIDITRAKRASLKQAALTKLGDLLRDLDDADDIASVAATVAGETLGVARVGFGLFDQQTGIIDILRDWTAPGMVSVAGRHQLADYGTICPDLIAGNDIVVADVEEDPRTVPGIACFRALDIRSMVNVPVRNHGRIGAIFFLHDRRARSWTHEVMTFVRNTADRVQAEIARVRAEEQREVLNHELSHRLKNTLSMVQSITMQTLRTSPDVVTARSIVEARLVALGKAHDVLLGGRRAGGTLRAIIEGALQIFDDDHRERFRLAGPALEIGTRATMPLALMIHELATNAAKYGALSGDGHIDIAWSVAGEVTAPSFTLRWAESGGPPVSPPTRSGFGTRLISRVLTGAIGAKVDLIYDPAGVCCLVEAPLSAFSAIDEPAFGAPRSP